MYRKLNYTHQKATEPALPGNGSWRTPELTNCFIDKKKQTRIVGIVDKYLQFIFNGNISNNFFTRDFSISHQKAAAPALPGNGSWRTAEKRDAPRYCSDGPRASAGGRRDSPRNVRSAASRTGPGL